MAAVAVLIRKLVEGFCGSEFKYIFSHIVPTRLLGLLNMPAASDINELYVQVRRRLVETGEWDQWVACL